MRKTRASPDACLSIDHPKPLGPINNAKKTLIVLMLPLIFLLVVAASLCRGALGSSPTTARRHSAVATAPGTDTLQKMIVESGSVTMDLDLNGVNGSNSLVARPVTLQFAV